MHDHKEAYQVTKVGIVGATGYTGIELIRFLANHPNIKLQALSSVSFEGQDIEDIYLNLLNILDLECTNSQEVIKQSDVIFIALPHGLSEPIADQCVKKGKVVIDLGADFRLNSEEVYEKWYGKSYEIKDIHKDAVYGLPEVYKEEIKKASIIANPGCYPTGASLGLIPLFKSDCIDKNSVIIDAKSGTTGTGRTPSQITHFSECNENIVPYGIGSHRHTPEIEQVLSELGQEEITLTFTPHLIPVSRGILSTMYLKMTKEMDLEELYKLYIDYYKDEKFVRILPIGKMANIRNVTHSNYCDISIHLDQRTNRLIVVSAIDNMVKGAAGQAIQNMNIRMGFEEEAGLNLLPPAF